MQQVTMIRHSIAAFPKDALTLEGIKLAESRRGDFQHFDRAIASGMQRAQETIVALGYPQYSVMPDFNELELTDINEPTAHEYVLESHRRYPELIKSTADMLIHGLIETSKDQAEKTLVVTHNLALSSLLIELTGQLASFNNLSGMVLSVSDGGVSFINRI